MRRRVALVVYAVIASVGCAGSEPDPSPEELPVTEGVLGRAPAAVGGVPSVVTLRAVGMTRADDGTAATVDQFGLSFSPRRLIVSAGKAVTFKNSEAALAHNVRVRSVEGDSTVFSSDANSGDSLRLLLEEEGGYDVLCDMHPGMSSFLFVTSAPFAVFAETDGAFHLERIPEGVYTLGVWSIDPDGRTEATVSVGPAATRVRLEPSH